jgi:KDO2-lipid IV(A) lauroyltransferase
VLDRRRPLLVVSAHYGSWEAGAYYLGLRGVKAHLVARSLDNPFLDRLFRHFRESTGHQVLSKKGDLERMRRVLAGGGVVCTLADQYAGSQQGLFVNFFGRPASTHKAVALLALRYRATIVVVGFQRRGPSFHYEARMSDLIDPRDYVNDEDPIRSITERATLAVERLVLHDPTQYLWLHRRWRNSRAA